ncbi:amino acid ABC transporter substrate-binding protein [Acinetobacter sp. MD2(2019)]|uniref:amino acid ABC transporter substrate-binding protein n=1 Tax=Acinetobacter sp. MD2(2019) TaxID=2605273 RepID=UPI002D1EE2DF|nr:amino acid ABC transporter substrate-binding protein [Acinetobacter sp. MD2(2019)]MEB3752825.1 amino acid ABC transporter substrate-binding protein [Acinetobacter sp. MD2(2019)]
MSLIKACLSSAVCLLSLSATSTFAVDTLAKIQRTGTIVIGHRTSSQPISYVVNGRPMGYAIDICNDVVAEVKKELHLPNLRVVYKATTPTDRIPMLKSGELDMECGTSTHSVVRNNDVNFSTNYYMAEIRMAVKRSSDIKSVDDLDNRKVVTTAGVIADKYLKRTVRGHDLNIHKLYGRDHADSFSLLATGKADAFVGADSTLAGLIATSGHPQDYKIVGEVLSTDPYAIMMPNNDPKLKALADRVVTNLWRSGKMDQLYKKWFLSPIPPHNLAVNMELNKANKQLRARPTDAGN